MGEDSAVSGPALVWLQASLDEVRAALIGLGAVAQNLRTVVLDLGEHLLLLDWDSDEYVTTIAVGGPQPSATATWLADQLSDFRPQVLPAPASAPVPTA